MTRKVRIIGNFKNYSTFWYGRKGIGNIIYLYSVKKNLPVIHEISGETLSLLKNIHIIALH